MHAYEWKQNYCTFEINCEAGVEIIHWSPMGAFVKGLHRSVKFNRKLSMRKPNSSVLSRVGETFKRWRLAAWSEEIRSGTSV